MQYEPRPAAPRMLFNFYWFSNAFGWECPSCPAHIQHGWFVELGGVIYAGPMPTFDPVKYMRQAAEDMKMPTTIYGCLPGKTEDHRPVLDKCESSFFTALAEKYESRFRLRAAWLRFAWYLVTLFHGIMVLLSEYWIAYKPHLMRCKCRLACFKKFCSFPRGTDEEIEAMDDHDWDRVRLRAYAKACVFLAITAIYDLWCSKAFISYLNTVQKDLPDDLSMNARLGTPFLLISWGNVALLTLATAMVYNRWKMGQQYFVQGGEISLDGVEGFEREPLAVEADRRDLASEYSDSGDEDAVLPGPGRIE